VWRQTIAPRNSPEPRSIELRLAELATVRVKYRASVRYGGADRDRLKDP